MAEGLPLLEAFKQDLYHCADCSYCVDAVWPERGITHVCPTMQSHTPLMSYSGRGYIAAARAWVEGAALDLDQLANRVFTCTTCGHCETVCPIGLRPTQVGRALRAELWARDKAPHDLREWRAQMTRDGNPFGQLRSARAAWLTGITPSSAADTLCYLPGCAAVAHPREARATVRLMQAAGYRVETLGAGDSCCGAPFFELGDARQAEALRTALAKKIPAGACVTSGLECHAHWQRGTGEHHSPQSFPEWAAAALLTGRLEARQTVSSQDVVVLESCQTRHAANIATAVRQIFKQLGVNARFANDNPRHVVCCGAAGGMPQIAPDSAHRMAAARLPESGTVVVVDPRCAAHLTEAGEVLSLALWLARAVGLADD